MTNVETEIFLTLYDVGIKHEFVSNNKTKNEVASYETTSLCWRCGSRDLGKPTPSHFDSAYILTLFISFVSLEIRLS